jgi:hypothetical protein
VKAARMIPESLMRAVLDQISDADLWAEWVCRRKALRAEVARTYQREYKRRMRAGVKKGKRGMRLMKDILSQ